MSSTPGRNYAEETLIPDYIVGGKTGTAQIWDSQAGEWMPHIYNHTFVGFVGAEKPEAVILVRIHEAAPVGHGYRIQAVVERALPARGARHDRCSRHSAAPAGCAAAGRGAERGYSFERPAGDRRRRCRGSRASRRAPCENCPPWLSELARHLPSTRSRWPPRCAGRLLHAGPPPIRGGAVDSRKVERGNAFFALAGERTDGHNYLADAARAARPRWSSAGPRTRRCSTVTPERFPPTVVLVADVLAALHAAARPGAPLRPAGRRRHRLARQDLDQGADRRRCSLSAGTCCATRPTRTTRSVCR